MSAQRFVFCSVGEQQYAMRVDTIREIVRAERLRRESRPDGCVGTVSLPGEDPVRVYSLADILNGRAGMRRPTGSDHIVITRQVAGVAGWLVDRIVRSHPMDHAAIQRLPAIGSPADRWFEGVLTGDERPTLVLSPSALDPQARFEIEDDTTPRVSHTERTLRPTDAPPPLVLVFATPALQAGRSLRCVVSARRIAAVAPLPAVTPVPGSAPQIAGIATWRGQVMPIVDYRQPDARTSDGRRLLVGCCGSGATIGFAVEAEITLRQAATDDRAVEATVTDQPGFIAGVFGLDGIDHALVDLDRLAALTTASPPFTAG